MEQNVTRGNECWKGFTVFRKFRDKKDSYGFKQNYLVQNIITLTLLPLIPCIYTKPLQDTLNRMSGSARHHDMKSRAASTKADELYDAQKSLGAPFQHLLRSPLPLQV